MYKNLVSGVNTLVPLINGNKVPYINFDNAATTPPFSSVIDGINRFSPIILLFTEVLDINPSYLPNSMIKLGL